MLASGVNVFFKPTQSHYIFVRVSDGGHVSRSAPLSEWYLHSSVSLPVVRRRVAESWKRQDD